MGDPYHFEERALPGGARLFHQHRDLPWTGFGIVILAGHMHDPVGQEGTAHLLEHQVSNGHVGDLPPMRRKEMMEWLSENRMSASLGATALYWTRYAGRAENGNVGTLARFLTDLVFRPGLDGDLEHEREIVRAERGHRVSDRKARIGEAMDRALFGGHRRTTVTGLPDDEVLDGLTLQGLTAFHRRHYGAANVRIVSIGGLQADAFAALLAPLVPDVPHPEAVRVSPIARLAPRPPDPRELHFAREDGRPAETLTVKWDWRMAEARAGVPQLAAAALSSLLHDHVRERQRAVYGIRAEGAFNYDHQRFDIVTKTDVSKLREVQAGVAAVLRDEAAIVARLPRLRRNFELQTLFEDENCGQVLDSAMTSVAARGRIRTLAESCGAILALTDEAVLEFVRERLDLDQALLSIIENQ